jgi:D-alanyl-D-alanine carboxypeptidase/D-alanyl-D-alanine-endopeptidase (penicillin-binding protein 4)
MRAAATLCAAVLYAAVLCLIAQPICATAAGADDKLSPQMRDVINDARFKHTHWGILVADRATGEVIYELDADKLFPPASTTKLYSVANALDALGSDYRFETPLYRRGAVNAKSVLDGDLILVAAGDLTLGGRTTSANEIEFTRTDHTYANPSGEAVLTSGDPLAGLNSLAKQVAIARIHRVHGQVIVDARLFDRANSTGSGPEQLSPIIINDNVIDITVTPMKVGEPAKVDWRPRSASLGVDARVDTTRAGGDSKIECRTVGEDRLIVRGHIAADRARFVYVQEVSDPAKWARTLLVEALERAGVEVTASAYESNPAVLLPKQGDHTGLVRVALLRSLPFSENARLILKVSHNLHASTLPLLVAARKGKRRLEDGLLLQHDFLKRAGLDADSISFGGGAGGASADYTTPRTNVALLRYIATRPDFAVFERGLPILGVDGTIANDVSPRSPARGKVRAKSGTLLWKNLMNDHYLLTTKALAGYLTAKSGRELVFSFVVNGVQIDEAIQARQIAKVLGHLCEIVREAR